MRDKHSGEEVEHVNYASTLPDSYEEISKERRRSVIKLDSRVMEFTHESGAGFTLYKKQGTGYVGCLMTSAYDTTYYEVDPGKVVGEEIEWSDSDCQLVELAVLPLRNSSWLLTYYDEEHTKTQMYQLINGDSIDKIWKSL